MKQGKFSKILKMKGFYLSLLTGVLAVVAICFVYFNTNSKTNNQNNDITNLNQSASGQTGDKSQNNAANQPGEDKTNVTDKTNSKDNDSLLENDVISEPSDKVIGSESDTKDQTTAKDNTTSKNNTSKNETSKKDDSVAVANQSKNTKLSFDQESDLLWPVSGNIIIPYDVEHGVRFATLDQYKTSDAIVIQSTVGTEVKAAAKCKVTSITESEETGTTITTDVGNDYSITYGQLENLKVKKGDVLSAGAVIGTVAKPTKYYVVEGPNLYFKVMEKEQSVNPLYLLK